MAFVLNANSFNASNGKAGAVQKYVAELEYGAFLAANNNMNHSVEAMELHFYTNITKRSEMKNVCFKYTDTSDAEATAGYMAEFKSDVKSPAAIAHATAGNIQLWLLMSRGAVRRYMTLVACTQTKTMLPKNFENFYKSKSIEMNVEKIASHIQFAASYEDPMVNLVRAEGKSEAFVVYHTNANSSAGLLSKMKAALGADLTHVFKLPDGDIADIDLCINNPSDATRFDAVSAKAKILLVCFLKAYGMFPDKYYWGEKYYDSIPPNIAKKTVMVLKKYMEIKLNVNDIDNFNLEHVANFFS